MIKLDDLPSIKKALDDAPQNPLMHFLMADWKHLHGDELGALAHTIAAQTLESYTSGTELGSVEGLCNVATGYFMKGDLEIAEQWYQLVLLIDPSIAIAYQNLAAIYSRMERLTEAEFCRERAYNIQRIFIEREDYSERQVLILCEGRESGNVPFRELLPTPKNARITYVIDYAAEIEDEQLPPYDLVFNAIGDPDVAAPLAGRLQRFATKCNRPLLNPPLAIVRTQRHRLAELLSGIENILLAPCIRLENAQASPIALTEHLTSEGFEFPILVRPAASHGGLGLVRTESIDELESCVRAIANEYYLTQYYDYRSTDGYYRKYRMIFIDREPFPYHLAISPHWMSHYFSSDMVNHPWKIIEESHFLHDPSAVIGTQSMLALAAIGHQLDLDYGGIDFTILPDGRLLVFEANATMLVHRERHDGTLAYKNIYVQHIVDAFEQMQTRLTSIGKCVT